VRRRWIGNRSAATVPPTLNKNHSNGVIGLAIYANPRSTITATIAESTNQAA
jgi:hypothetical protein